MSSLECKLSLGFTGAFGPGSGGMGSWLVKVCESWTL